METLKQFMDAFRLTLYEILAVLVPGAILVEGARVGTPPLLLVNTTTGTGMVYYLVLSYVAGLAAQGIANLFFRRIPNLVRFGKLDTIPPTRKQPLNAQTQAGVVVAKLFGVKDEEFVTGYCLSSLGESHPTYDRFLALRDTVRSLSLVLPVGWYLAAYGADWPLTTKSIALLLGITGLLERYFRFDRAADDVLFNQFLATRGESPASDKAAQKEKVSETNKVRIMAAAAGSAEKK